MGSVLRRRPLGAMLAVLAIAVMVSPVAAFAFESPNDPSSTELVERPKEWDGKKVTFLGEVIGEAMVRGDHAWLHLNDDAYMYVNITEGTELSGYNTGMPVWVSAELAEQVTLFGDYRNSGDVVQVTGTFNAACAEHGGDMDIHAESLEIAVPGHRAPDPTNPRKYGAALVLAVGAGAVWWANRRATRHESRGLLH